MEKGSVYCGQSATSWAGGPGLYKKAGWARAWGSKPVSSILLGDCFKFPSWVFVLLSYKLNYTFSAINLLLGMVFYQKNRKLTRTVDQWAETHAIKPVELNCSPHDRSLSSKVLERNWKVLLAHELLGDRCLKWAPLKPGTHMTKGENQLK